MTKEEHMQSTSQIGGGRIQEIPGRDAGPKFTNLMVRLKNNIGFCIQAIPDAEMPNTAKEMESAKMPRKSAKKKRLDPDSNRGPQRN